MFMAYTQSEHLWDARTTLTARHGGSLMLTMSIRMSTPGKQDFIRPAPRPSAVPCGGISDFLGSGADHRVPQHFPVARMERKRHPGTAPTTSNAVFHASATEAAGP